MFCWSGFNKAVDLLILSSGDLDDLGLHVVHPSLYLIQVFVHPFAFAFVIPIHLVGDDLRVSIKNHTCGPCYFGEIESCHQGFLLCFIVGCREVEANHTFNLVSFERKKHNACSTSLFVRWSICMYAPLRTLIYPFAFPIGELRYEISDNLSLDGSTRAVLNIKLA